MTDPMPGRLARPWCPHGRRPAGPDCANASPSKRQTRRRLARELAREVRDVLTFAYEYDADDEMS